MRRIARRLIQRGGNHPLDLGIAHLARSARSRLIEQPIKSAHHKPAAPLADRLRVTQRLRHLAVGRASRTAQHDACAQRQGLRGLASRVHSISWLFSCMLNEVTERFFAPCPRGLEAALAASSPRSARSTSRPPTAASRSRERCRSRCAPTSSRASRAASCGASAAARTATSARCTSS